MVKNPKVRDIVVYRALCLEGWSSSDRNSKISEHKLKSLSATLAKIHPELALGSTNPRHFFGLRKYPRLIRDEFDNGIHTDTMRADYHEEFVVILGAGKRGRGDHRDITAHRALWKKQWDDRVNTALADHKETRLLGESWLHCYEWSTTDEPIVSKTNDEQRQICSWREEWGHVVVREDFVHVESDASKQSRRGVIIELHARQVPADLEGRDRFLFEVAPFVLLFFVKASQYYARDYEDNLLPKLNDLEGQLSDDGVNVDRLAKCGRLSALRPVITRMANNLNDFQRAIADCHVAAKGIRIASEAIRNYLRTPSVLTSQIDPLYQQMESDLEYYQTTLNAADRSLDSARTIVSIYDAEADQLLNRIVLVLGTLATLFGFMQVADLNLIRLMFRTADETTAMTIRAVLAASAIVIVLASGVALAVRLVRYLRQRIGSKIP